MIFMSNTHVFWKQISSAFFSLTNTEPDLSPFFDPEIITEYDPDNPAQFDEEIYSRWFAWCSVCGFPFVRITANKEFCSRECARPASRNTKRTEIRAAHDLTFIGIDGEGVSTYSDDGKITRHDYVLMIAAGDGIEPMILHKNGKRLTTYSSGYTLRCMRGIRTPA
jgi:predicted nucleic acid-binding Zn ribbon protein